MKLIELLVNLFYPLRCFVCNKVITQGEICVNCEDDTSKIAIGNGNELSKDGVCLSFISLAMAVYQYATPIKQAILRLKFYDRQDLVKPIAKVMECQIRSCNKEHEFSIIIAVPSSKRELRKRNIDVPLELGKELAKLLELPFCEKILIKTINTKRQMQLSGNERRVNLIGVFDILPNDKLRGAHVLLVDDVITTGTTLNECAKALLSGGADKVSSICIAAAIKPKS